jgi:preprotein translocase subunit SecD
MNIKKPLLLAGVGTVVGLASVTGVVSAHSNGQSPSGSLADKIAQRFNLDKNEVQKTIDEAKTDRSAKRQQTIEQRLEKAVTDGKITAEQKDAILAKYQELRSYMDSIKDKPAAEQRQLMKQKQAEIQQWAKDNGLSVYVHMHAHGHGPHTIKEDDQTK